MDFRCGQSVVIHRRGHHYNEVESDTSHIHITDTVHKQNQLPKTTTGVDTICYSAEHLKAM